MPINPKEMRGQGSSSRKDRASPQGIAKERRGFDRLTFETTAILTEMNDFGSPGASWIARIADLSRSGIGLRSRRFVPQNRRVLLELRTTEPPKTKVLYGIVCQSRYSEGEGYVVGVRFQTLPNTLSIRAWLTNRGLAA